MPAKSLVQLCQSFAASQANKIDDLGDEIQYELCKPILKQVRSGEQLARLEDNSPQLIGETESEWRELIARDFKHEKIETPADPLEWRAILKRLQDEANARQAKSRAALRASLGASKAEREEHSSVSLGRVLGPKTAKHGHRAPRPKTAGGAFLQKAKAEARSNPKFSRKNPVIGPRNTPTNAFHRPTDPGRPVGRANISNSLGRPVSGPTKPSQSASVRSIDPRSHSSSLPSMPIPAPMIALTLSSASLTRSF